MALTQETIKNVEYNTRDQAKSNTCVQSYKACYAKCIITENFCDITQFSKLQSCKKCVLTDFSNLL